MLSRIRPFGERYGRAVLTWGILPLSIMLLAWQPVVLQPNSGLDLSWGAGLDMALHGGLTFGHQVVFTFGPLGFLGVNQLWFGDLAELSFVYLVLTRLALAAALFAGARRTFGAPVAFLISVVVASVDTQLTEIVVVLILTVWAVVTGLSGRRALALALGLGALTGLELLYKESFGLATGLLTAVALVTLPVKRVALAAASAAAAILTVLICWAASGQPLSGLPGYLKSLEQIVFGYAPAMSLSVTDVNWAYTAAFVALALGILGALQTTVGCTRRQRAGVLLLWLGFWFQAFKEGFVRADSVHVAEFLEAALAGLFAFRWRREHRLYALLGSASLLALSLAVQSKSLTSDLDPSRAVTAAFNEAGDVLSASRQASIQATGQREIKRAEPIDASLVSLLRGHTVAVYPTEIALAWAYKLDWRPLPVLQSYAAYTSALDELDANFLASPRAPERILLQPTIGIDGRILSYDQAMATRAILCRYQVMRATARFAVLGRGRDRCSAPRLIRVDNVDWNVTVPVPQPPGPNSIVLVDITGIGIGGLEQVQNLLWKPAQRSVTLNGGNAQRLIEGTAADGLPLWVAGRLDFPIPFNMIPQATSIEVAKDGQSPTGGRPITYRFYVQSFSPAAAPHR